MKSILLRRKQRTAEGFKSQAWLAHRVHAVYISVLLIILITCLGTAGYVLLEGWSIFEAFFMTVITLSTVGYGEVQPLSFEGRIFSSLLIIFGMGIAAYAFGTIARAVFRGELNRYGAFSKMQKKKKSIKDHIIICGYGRLSKFIIPDLLEQGKEIVVIDNNPDIIHDLQALGIVYVEGSAYEDEILIEAGIERASSLLSLLPHDSDNVFTTLCARDLNPKLNIAARTESAVSEKKLRRAGANQIISPYRIGASRAVQQLIHPYVNDFLEIAKDEEGNHLVLERVVISEKSNLAGKTIEESGIRKQTGVTVAVCSWLDGEMVLLPGPDTVIKPGSSLTVMGTGESIEKLGALL